jgi:hypothetical protein
LQHPPYHPKWRDVNLAATIPGWTRFSAAQDMLDKIEQQQGATAQQQVDFDTFLSRQPHMHSSDAERDALFRDFLQCGRSNRIIPIKNNGNWTTTDVTDLKMVNLHPQRKAEAVIVIVIHQPKFDN